VLKKTASLLTFMVVFCITFTGCYDKKEIDELAYVMAIGFDKGNSNSLKLTFQCAIIQSKGGGGGSSDNEQSKNKKPPPDTVSVESSDIYTGLSMAGNALGKQLNLSHAQALVFSEEIARSGAMQKYIHSMIRNREFRPNMFVIVAKGNAEDYINSVDPKSSSSTAKYYELKYTTYNYSGYTTNTSLYRFYNELESYAVEPVATFVDASPKNSDEPDSQSTKPIGLAAFGDAKMVGEIPEQQVAYYLLTNGYLRSVSVPIPDPKQKGEYVVLNLSKARNPKATVTIDGGKPKINLKLRLEADFVSIESGEEYERKGLTELFEQSAEGYLRDETLKFLNYTAKDLKSDVCGFGKHAKWMFSTWDEWRNSNWQKLYSDSDFDVTVDLKVRRPGLLIRTQTP